MPFVSFKEPAATRCRSPHLAGRTPPPARLADFLEENWTLDIRAGVVVYDCSDIEVASAGPYRFHLIPGRSVRPGTWNADAAPPEGLFVPHGPCPFDGDDLVRHREVLSVERERRLYHLICNRFPVTAPHYLGVRPWNGLDEDDLPQHFHGAEEIADLLVFALAFEPEDHMSVFFNSNLGGDGSSGGSSINHWHFQFFPHRLDREHPLRASAIEQSTIADWPASCFAVDATRENLEAAADEIWDHIVGVHARNGAYNVEILRLDAERVRAIIFPRCPAEPTRIPNVGELMTNFGGWELSGDFVIPTRELFEWLRDHPEEAIAISEKRLRETTRLD